MIERHDVIQSSTMDMTDSKTIAFSIPPQVAQLAIAAARQFKAMSLEEMRNLESMMKAETSQKKPKARNVFKLCGLVGFMLAMELDKAREQRLAELNEPQTDGMP